MSRSAANFRDNVLRGGLTPKHIDVPELLKNIRFEATEPNVILGVSVDGSVSVFQTPAPDFELSRIGLLKGDAIATEAPVPSRSLCCWRGSCR